MKPDRKQASVWMDRASRGDGEKFGALADAVQDTIYRFCLAQGLGEARAADATQETFLRAWQGRQRWRVGADAVAWLYGIAMNVVRERRRQWVRHRSVSADLAALAAPAAPDPLAAQERVERLRDLADALGRLPERQREAVACRYLRRMTVRQTAEVMGCAEGTVKAAVHAALRNLRESMVRQP